jgi:hypothetical protein
MLRDVTQEAFRGIQVSRYVLDDSSQTCQREIFHVYSEPLLSKGWDLLACVREDGSSTKAYAKIDGDRFRGIFVVTIDGD